jgi:hypothetical protein
MASPDDRPDHLRVLVAGERENRVAAVAVAVVALGHEVIAREIELEDVAAVTDRERPDVALVGLGESLIDAVAAVVNGKAAGSQAPRAAHASSTEVPTRQV